MKAWRVHDFGEPRDVLVLEDVPPPTAADLEGLGMTHGRLGAARRRARRRSTTGSSSTCRSPRSRSPT